MKRKVYKFRFGELEQVAEAFGQFCVAVFSYEQVKNIEITQLVNMAMGSIGNSIKGVGILAKVLVPLGLRLTDKEIEEITPEEALQYLPLILEENKGFFIVLLKAVDKSIASLPLESLTDKSI